MSGPTVRTAPARPAVIQTDDEQSRDATDTKFIGHHRAQYAAPGEQCQGMPARATSDAPRHSIVTSNYILIFSVSNAVSL
jgi:hypothetical protein